MIVTECHGTTRPSRRTIGLAACAMFLMAASGCTPKARVFQVGERVQVSGVVYTIHEAQWLTQLDAGTDTPRMPRNRFLVIHFTVSNAGNKEATIPLLSVVDAAGAEHLELAEGKGVSEWLGILRTMNPTESKEGRIVFDLPVAQYSLKVTDGKEQEQEQTALVGLPVAAKGATMDSSPLLNEPKQ